MINEIMMKSAYVKPFSFSFSIQSIGAIVLIEWNMIQLFHTDLKYFSCFNSYMLFLYYAKYKIIHFSRAFFPHHRYWQHSLTVSKKTLMTLSSQRFGMVNLN